MHLTNAPSDAPHLAPASFEGFTFAGEQRLDILADFYGIATPVHAAQVTLSQFLSQYWRGDARPGCCASIGSVRLVVLEVEEGVITKVGLAFYWGRSLYTPPIHSNPIADSRTYVQQTFAPQPSRAPCSAP